MDKEIIVVGDNELTPFDNREDTDIYGMLLRHSTICPICISLRSRDINLARARDLKTLKEISREFSFSEDTLNTHFTHHYDISSKQKKLLRLKENTDTEDLSIVSKVFDGELDAFSALQDILKSKAKRLHGVNQRLNKIEEQFEINNEDVEDKQEYALLHRTANDIENSMQKIYKILHDFMFPTNKEALANAVLQYKLNVLTQLIDSIQEVFLDMEKEPSVAPIISLIRQRLSAKINAIEDEILKSGGSFTSE